MLLLFTTGTDIRFVRKCQSERDRIIEIAKKLKVADNVTVSITVDESYDEQDQKTTFTVESYGSISACYHNNHIDVQMNDGSQLVLTWNHPYNKFISKNASLIL